MPTLPRPLAAVIAVTAVVLALAGCSPSPATPTASGTPSPTTTASPTPSPSPSPDPTASVDPNAPAGQCEDDALQVTVEPDPEGAGAGSVVSRIVFTNTGGDPCELRGVPGVSVLAANGVMIGEPAQQQEPSDPPTITLTPGAAAVAELRSVNIGADGGPLGEACPVVEGASYQIYPPHSFQPVDVAAQVPACESDEVWMTVGPVEQG